MNPLESPTPRPVASYNPVRTSAVVTTLTPFERIVDAIWINNREVLMLGVNNQGQASDEYAFYIFNIQVNSWEQFDYQPVDCQSIIRALDPGSTQTFEFQQHKLYSFEYQKLVLQGRCQSAEGAENNAEQNAYNLFFNITRFGDEFLLDLIPQWTLPNGDQSLDFLLSPDQTRLLYAQPNESKKYALISSSSPALENFFTLEEDLDMHNAAWTQYSDLIATTGLVETENGPKYPIHIFNLRTLTVEKVYTSDHFPQHLEWAYDNRYIFFTSAIDEIEGAWLLNAKTQELRYVFESPVHACDGYSTYGRSAGISPSGEHLFIDKSAIGNDRCLIEIVEIDDISLQFRD